MALIGSGGTYYRIEIAINDPRQHEVWWREVGQARYQADAMTTGRVYSKKHAVRVVKVDETCVWANATALVANGDKVT